jgi:hypothetical protein
LVQKFDEGIFDEEKSKDLKKLEALYSRLVLDKEEDSHLKIHATWIESDY